MVLTSRAGNPSSPGTLGFNQTVGPSMAGALKEVVSFVESKHNGWPKGQTMEISFEDKYSPKDGPSAAVACALLLDSAIAGTEIDPGFAVTGDMDSEGQVKAIGGVAAKIRGAATKDCSHVAIPLENAPAITDLAITDGFGPICQIQVFSIETFDQAKSIASQERDAKIASAMTTFSQIQAVYERSPETFPRTLPHPKMQEKLQEVLQGCPNHLSAALLLAYGQGRGPKQLSVTGSISYLAKLSKEMLTVIDSEGKVQEKEGSLDADHLADAVSNLRRVRPSLHPSSLKVADHLLEFGTMLLQWQNNRPSSPSHQIKLIGALNRSGDAAQESLDTLLEHQQQNQQ